MSDVGDKILDGLRDQPIPATAVRLVMCDWCEGAGYYALPECGGGWFACPTCGGTGSVVERKEVEL